MRNGSPWMTVVHTARLWMSRVFKRPITKFSAGYFMIAVGHRRELPLHTNTTGRPWFPYLKPRPGASLRLFCLPYAGGNALIFRKWADLLPPFIEVFAVEIPGRGTRMQQQPFTSLRALVDAVEPAIGNYLDKPFAFFGHSMGAAISFELTHKLRSTHGVQPAHLIFSGRRAPQVPDRERPAFNLPHDEFIEELRRLQGTPTEVLANPELLEVVAPVLRADFELIETYRYAPQPRLACPITVLGGITDADIIRADLEAWREHASGLFSLHMFPGNHFFLHSHQTMVLQTIARALSQSAGAG